MVQIFYSLAYIVEFKKYRGMSKEFPKFEAIKVTQPFNKPPPPQNIFKLLLQLCNLKKMRKIHVHVFKFSTTPLASDTFIKTKKREKWLIYWHIKIYIYFCYIGVNMLTSPFEHSASRSTWDKERKTDMKSCRQHFIQNLRTIVFQKSLKTTCHRSNGKHNDQLLSKFQYKWGKCFCDEETFPRSQEFGLDKQYWCFHETWTSFCQNLASTQSCIGKLNICGVGHHHQYSNPSYPTFLLLLLAGKQSSLTCPTIISHLLLFFHPLPKPSTS